MNLWGIHSIIYIGRLSGGGSFEGGRLSGTGAADIIYIIRPGVDFQGHTEETRKC